MLRAGSTPIPRSKAARALLAGAEAQCPSCGEPLIGRRKVCSGKCRAKLSRERKADELRALVLAARQAIEALERRLLTP